MRDHSPYIEWILSDEPLPEASQSALRNHLAKCVDCRKVAAGWESARQVLTDATSAAPRNGFPQRWKALAESRAKAPNRRQVWVTLAPPALAFV